MTAKTYEIRPGQSIELLKALHILTRDGKMNQDSRRKLKQVYHLFQFIEPLLRDALAQHADIELVDHGAGILMMSPDQMIVDRVPRQRHQHNHGLQSRRNHFSQHPA